SSTLKIVHQGDISENLRHLSDIAHCFGITAEFIDVKSNGGFTTAVMAAQGQTGVVFDVESLKSAATPQMAQEVAQLISAPGLVLLLLVTNADEAANEFVKALTLGSVTQILRSPLATSVH